MDIFKYFISFFVFMVDYGDMDFWKRQAIKDSNSRITPLGNEPPIYDVFRNMYENMNAPVTTNSKNFKPVVPFKKKNYFLDK